MVNDFYKSVFVSIVGPEKDGDNTLVKCKDKIEKDYLAQSQQVIQSSNEIRNDTSIYLVAHGDDPLLVTSAKFGDKTPRALATILSEMLKNSGFRSDNKFSGRVVLEGCHSAEFGVDKNTQNAINSIMQDGDQSKISKNLLAISGVKVGEPSFLERFRVELKSGSAANLLDSSMSLGGYLGFGFDGDYAKTGYGIAASCNPLTAKYQNSLGVEAQKTLDGALKYSEEDSHQEIRIGQKASCEPVVYKPKAIAMTSPEKMRG